MALVLPAGAARTLSAQQIEQGDNDLLGSLGDGEGKWQLAHRSPTSRSRS